MRKRITTNLVEMTSQALDQQAALVGLVEMDWDLAVAPDPQQGIVAYLCTAAPSPRLGEYVFGFTQIPEPHCIDQVGIDDVVRANLEALAEERSKQLPGGVPGIELP